MNRAFRRVAFLCLWLIPVITCAESLSKTSFQYKGGKLGYLARDEVYSAWNTNDSSSVLKPGMKVMFFGRAEGCSLQASNGPVKNQGSIKFGKALDLTGISLATKGSGQQWAPSGDTQDCDKSVRQQMGDSFVHINEDPVNGGIGIFTFTGPEQSGRRSFFRQFDKSGKNGAGANANIEGTFVAFRFDWKKEDAVRPWAGVGFSDEQRKAEFRTVQSVAVASVPDKAGSGEPVQAKQQFIVSFINHACFQRGSAKKKLCQLQYLFNVAVYRAGVVNWDNVEWFKSAGLFLDPVQGGMPVIHGPIGQKGVTSVDQKTGLDLYASMNQGSRHETFKDNTFQVQVSFKQLKNALKLIVANNLRKNINQIKSIDLDGMFGESWDEPSEWVLLSINVSQEIYNPDSNARALIGGNIKDLAVGSASLH